METYQHESQLYTGIIPLLCQLSRNLNFMSQWSDENGRRTYTTQRARETATGYQLSSLVLALEEARNETDVDEDAQRRIIEAYTIAIRSRGGEVRQ